MKTTNITLAIAVLAGGTTWSACGLFGGDDSSKKDKVTPAVGGADSGSTGAAAGKAGGGPTGGGGTTGGAGGGAGDASAASCAGLPGPVMVQLQSPSGTKYCMDRTEVTQEQYAGFLKAVTTKPGSEHPKCAENKDYTPETNKPGIPWEPNDCLEENWTPELTPNRPVVCISWCDAYAYCGWAGKRLCGKIGGGSGSGTDATNPSASQWYNACSQGGTTKYPYGNSFDGQACESIYTGLPKKDVAARVGCKGAAEPYASIRDLSGSVAEFTDECVEHPISGTSCMLRGGSLSDGNPAKLSCDSYGTVNLGIRDTGSGFRCCKDLP